jgi:hypothetical protein
MRVVDITLDRAMTFLENARPYVLVRVVCCELTCRALTKVCVISCMFSFLEQNCRLFAVGNHYGSPWLICSRSCSLCFFFLSPYGFTSPIRHMFSLFSSFSSFVRFLLSLSLLGFVPSSGACYQPPISAKRR